MAPRRSRSPGAGAQGRDEKRGEGRSAREAKTEIKEEEVVAVEEAPVVKREPLSLEELVAKKKADEEAKSKAKFLTKEERVAEALRRRQEQVTAAEFFTQP